MKQLHLVCSLGDRGLGNWQYKQAQPEKIRDLDYLLMLAKTAEQGCFDALFFDDLNRTDNIARGQQTMGLEPWTTFAALGTLTEHIGLIVTASTTDNQPNNVARRLASLDHISQGRSGWHMVTQWEQHTGRQYTHETDNTAQAQYNRANEFVVVAKKLWDSWSGNAIIIKPDGKSGVDGSQNHPVNHKGAFFSVKAPLDIPRPPQGYPVLAYGGQCDEGDAFAAVHAELVFTRQSTIEQAVAFRQQWHERVRSAGRLPDAIRVIPALSPILASSDAQARQIARDLLDSRGELAQKDKASGLLEFVGTPDTLAELMVQWLDHGAADGFNLVFPYLPDAVSVFVEEVVPRLQARGVVRKQYAGTTLRSHFGLAELYHHADQPTDVMVTSR